MTILQLVIIGFWILMSYKAILAYKYLKEKVGSRKEITAFTILLLAALNISRGIMFLFVDSEPFQKVLLLEYFYVGSSVFQLLLSWFVLKYVHDKRIRNN